MELVRWLHLEKERQHQRDTVYKNGRTYITSLFRALTLLSCLAREKLWRWWEMGHLIINVDSEIAVRHCREKQMEKSLVRAWDDDDADFHRVSSAARSLMVSLKEPSQNKRSKGKGQRLSKTLLSGDGRTWERGKVGSGWRGKKRPNHITINE